MDIQRTRLRIDNAEVHVKTYRPKKYNSPARSLWDHPKIEATAYYTKSENGQERIPEIRQLARDIIATIVDFVGLEEDLLPGGFQFDFSGPGSSREDLLRDLKTGALVDALKLLNNTPDVLLRNPTARKVLLFLAKNGPSSSLEIAKGINARPRTVRHALLLLKNEEIISSFRRGNHVFYQIGGEDVGSR